MKDPYEAQGKNFRVHHPVQPKTQVERWKLEVKENREAITLCRITKRDSGSLEEHTQNCENCSERVEKVLQLTYFISQATQPIHPRYQTGIFADDKVTLLDKIKKLLCLK